MKDKKRGQSAYVQLRIKLFLRLLCMFVTAVVISILVYKLIWSNKGGDWIVSVFQHIFKMDYYSALSAYHKLFRSNEEIIWICAILVIFICLLSFVLRWFTEYFDIVNQGISALIDDENVIDLPPEMLVIEQKLNVVRQTLKERKIETQLIEQKKNDLVMYLAHDIRTPLTSVIGYLNLIEEAGDMPPEQRKKYVHITLNKAYRLEKMVNEFFEIARYNLQQMNLIKETIDLYYMLVQMTDEFSSALAEHGNTITLKADENLTVYGDPDKLARAFSNIIKNAISYSFPNTEIIISANEIENAVEISFENKGKTISSEKIDTIFEKFYRLDESRTSNTGGSGLGLAIAKEIIALHKGTIVANSENDTITFVVTIPFGINEKLAKN